MADIDRCVDESLKAVIEEQLKEGRENTRKRDEEFLAKFGLTRVGYWYSEHEPHLPKPTVDHDRSPEIKAKILGYLKGGRVLCKYMGYSGCRVCDLGTNGTKDITDDKYIWPEGLAHYIEEHDTMLPDEFVDHILKFAIPF